jgi:hypothetical protein
MLHSYSDSIGNKQEQLTLKGFKNNDEEKEFLQSDASEPGLQYTIDADITSAAVEQRMRMSESEEKTVNILVIAWPYCVLTLC